MIDIDVDIDIKANALPRSQTATSAVGGLASW